MISFKKAVLANAALLMGQSHQYASAADNGKISFTGKLPEKGKPESVGTSDSAGILNTEVAGKKSYVALLKQPPIVAHNDESGGFESTKPAPGEKIDPSSEKVEKYGTFLMKEQSKVAESVGLTESDFGHQYKYTLNGFQAFMTEDQVNELRQNDDVFAVLEDGIREKLTDSSEDFLGLTNPGGPWATGYNGEGVVVGVIDNGIWPEHPSFADDGTYPPLSGYQGLPCEFGNTTHNENDAPFTCNNKLLGARQVLDTYRSVVGARPDEFDSARDDDGHGSHTTSTAAGNAGVPASIGGNKLAGSDVLRLGRANSSRGVSGVAPRARIIHYKGLGFGGGFFSDLAMAIDLAVEDGVDVINYSVGSQTATLDGPDDIAFLFAQDAGVFVAAANGNSGPGAATTGSPANVPWLTSVGASTQARKFQGSASSIDGWEFFGASLTNGTDELTLVDAADAGSELCFPGELDPSMVANKIVLCLRGAIARVDKSMAVMSAGGAGMILYNANDGEDLATDNHIVPSVHISFSDGAVIKDYISSSGAGASARINGGEKAYAPAPIMAAFSSRGPNTIGQDIIKPDITAPGVSILAANTPFPIGGVQGELFQAISGTSMSSPHIAGVFALIKQAHPEWTPAMAKSAIMTTAHQNVIKEDGITPADPFDFGAGHVDVGSVGAGSPFMPGFVYDAGLFDFIAFMCGALPGFWTQETCDFVESQGFSTEGHNLNYPSIGAHDIVGNVTVTRTVTSVADDVREYTPIVEMPEGYDVQVSPETLILGPGESATFEVEMRNIGAPAEEWRTGSLTWVDSTGQYHVYSPIAVHTEFSAPDEIVASPAVEGNLTFQVVVGFDGAYSAAAHGLEPADVIEDNVVQDPDFSFDPDDGFSNAHVIEVSGAALLRTAMPPFSVDNSSAIDLDLYLFNPLGEFVDFSFNAGTDELIDVPLPMDGNWTVFVHGWWTNGTSVDYTLFTWTVSATPGGNLSVDDAPDTIGSGDVDVSWTNAAAGEWHLGAVSHTGGPDGVSELLGLTVIDVNNVFLFGEEV